MQSLLLVFLSVSSSGAQTLAITLSAVKVNDDIYIGVNNWEGKNLQSSGNNLDMASSEEISKQKFGTTKDGKDVYM